jgi:hypothetical protein
LARNFTGQTVGELRLAFPKAIHTASLYRRVQALSLRSGDADPEIQCEPTSRISTDDCPHQQEIRRLPLLCDYPILADPDKKVAAAYGVPHAGTPGNANRWTFYIGPDG